MSSQPHSIQTSDFPDYYQLKKELGIKSDKSRRAVKKTFSSRMLIIYIFTGLCGLLFLRAGAALAMKSLGILPNSPPTQIPIPTGKSVNISNVPAPLPTSQISECVSKKADRQQATVVEVVAGDTIDVQFPDGSVQRVHYLGMTTPGINVDGYDSAIAANKQLVSAKEVILIKDVSNQDKFGRLLRYVFVGETFVNYELVAEGWANLESFPPDVACADMLHDAQQQAILAGLGLWSNPYHPFVLDNLCLSESPHKPGLYNLC